MKPKKIKQFRLDNYGALCWGNGYGVRSISWSGNQDFYTVYINIWVPKFTKDPICALTDIPTSWSGNRYMTPRPVQKWR